MRGGGLGGGVDPLLIGILMGGSAVGVLYLLEEKLMPEYHIFKFPFMVTLFAGIYILLAVESIFPSILVLAALWAPFGGIFVFRREGGSLGKAARKLIECCKHW